MWKDHEGEKRKQNVIRRKKKSCECYLEGKMWNWILISFLFSKNVIAYEIWGLWRTKCSQATPCNSPQITRMGGFPHVINRRNCKGSGAPFSPLTHLLPVPCHLAFSIHLINVSVTPTMCQVQLHVVKMQSWRMWWAKQTPSFSSRTWPSSVHR